MPLATEKGRQTLDRMDPTRDLYRPCSFHNEPFLVWRRLNLGAAIEHWPQTEEEFARD